MMTDTLLILAGGVSSRMKMSEDKTLSDTAITQANTRSKALILINNRPMLDYLLYNAKRAGISRVIIVINQHGQLFKNYYGTKDSGNNFHDLDISYAIQTIPEDRQKPLGTADAVLQAMNQYPELKQKDFLVCNSDNLYSSDTIDLLRSCIFPNAFIAYDRNSLDYSMDRIARFALTQIDSNGYLSQIIEKPAAKDLERYKGADGLFRVSMNIFKFRGSQFHTYLETCPIHPVRNEKELPTAILAMIQDDPRAMMAITRAEHVPDLTGKTDIHVMNQYLSQHIPDLDWD